MKRQLLMITCTALALCAVARLLPENAQKQPRWVIDASMPETIPMEGIIDLSDASVTRAYDTHYRVYGDTLVCRTMPGMRDWFVLRDGALWNVGANNRVARHAFSHGVLYLPAEYAETAYSCADTLTVNAIDAVPTTVTVNSTLGMAPGPAFILTYGDTIPSTVEVSELRVLQGSGGTTISTFSRRWYADGYIIPVVEETGVLDGGELYSTLTVCPPSEQPIADMPLSRGGLKFGAPQQRDNSDERCIDIVRQGDFITTGNAPGDDGTRVSVCDIQGRVIRTGVGKVPTDGLPPGWYIITVTGSGLRSSVKFRID